MALSVFPWKNKGEPEPTALDRQNLNAAEEALAAQVTSGAIAPPSSVVSENVEEEATQVEGTLEPAMPTGKRLAVFAYKIKGTTVVKPPTGAPSGFSEALIRVEQNVAGGHALSTSGITWNGSEPVWKTTPNAVNLIAIFTVNGGASWEGVGAEVGATGATGPEGFNPENLLLPSEVKTFIEPGASTSEERAAVAQSIARTVPTGSLLTPASGIPVLAAVAVPPKKVIRGIGFFVGALEGTPANRTHLWVALLNAKREVLARSADFTSSTNTAFSINKIMALKLESSYETGPAGELLYLMWCEVMSSTVALSIGFRELSNALLTPPVLCGTGAAATTPPALAATITLTAGFKYPYLVAIT
jgi:hypothetical protein